MKPKSKSSSKTKGSRKRVASAAEPASPPSPSVQNLPDVTPFDDERHCPRYRALLDRDPDDDPATADELDPLQHELEQMLLHNMDRQAKLTDQLSRLTSGQVPSTSELAQQRLTPRFIKRSDTPPGKVTIKTSGAARLPVKESEVVPVPHYDVLGRRRIFFWPQNHMPDKFWQFVGEHCQAVEPEEMDALKHMLRECGEDKMAKYYRVPGMGKHYKLRWAEEDKAKESARSRKSESESVSSRSQLKRKASSSELTEAKKAKTNGHVTQGENFSLGPLTERLVQALIEEQTPTVVTGNNAKQMKDIAELNGLSASPNKALVKSLNLGNMAALERRIKRELEAQGLLDAEDTDDAKPSTSKQSDDEVTAELRVRQEELRQANEENRRKLSELMSLAEQSLARGEDETELQSADQQILDLHSRFYSMVPKRKPCNKKERDQLTAAIDERQRLVEKIDTQSSD